MTVETTDTRNVCVRGEFVAKIQVCLQTFEFFRSQTLISCVYLDCVVHGQSNKGNIKVSALQASVCETTRIRRISSSRGPLFFYHCLISIYHCLTNFGAGISSW